VIIFGAATLGEVTLAACWRRGIPVECFVDDRVTGPINGVEVIRTQDLKARYPQASFYLTSPNIEDMIKPLEGMGYKDWHSFGEVVNPHDITKDDFSDAEYTVEHVKYLARTALHHHDNYLHPERLTVQSVDLIVTEKCTMKCADCSNLMQYYEAPENADLNETLKMIGDFLALMDEAYEFRVIGGEPFVNKEVHLIVERLTAEEKVKRVSIFTNGTIVPREHQFAALTHEKVRFFITDYDELSRNLTPLLAELDRWGIAYVSEKANGWTECASLEKHNRTVAENEALWTACCAKNLATLADGRLYRCPFAANAFKLGAVPDYTGDYLTVDTASREDVGTFLRGKTYIETCDHCNGRSYGDQVITPAVQVKKPLPYKKYVLKQVH